MIKLKFGFSLLSSFFIVAPAKAGAHIPEAMRSPGCRSSCGLTAESCAHNIPVTGSWPFPGQDDKCGSFSGMTGQSKKKNIMLKTILLSALLFIFPYTFAQRQPLKLSSDSRIEVVAYSQYDVVPIHGTTFTTTQIIFGKDEYVENVQNGDLGAWTASINKAIPNMMFVKPTAYDSHTNMTVVTNKHTYYFTMDSNAQGENGQRAATYAIKFIYPDEQKNKVEQEIIEQEKQKQAEISAFQNRANYNWHYSFHGDSQIVPKHVFDDGKFTYMQLQHNQTVPAVFAVDNPDGKESVVNYRQDGEYLVIQRVAPQFTVRAGADEVASIFNDRMIKKLEHGVTHG